MQSFTMACFLTSAPDMFPKTNNTKIFVLKQLEVSLNEYIIFTDSCCDVPPELLAQWGVPYANCSYFLPQLMT